VANWSTVPVAQFMVAPRASEPDGNIVAMTSAALDQLDPIWPAWLLVAA
jgi:hypothetical protein